MFYTQEITVKHIDQFSTIVFRKLFSVSLPPHAISNHPLQQKRTFLHTYVYHALKICSDPYLFNEFNYLKCLAPSTEYNPSVIGKALDKFKKPNCTV